VLFESSNGLFGGIDTMVMRRDQLDCHPVGTDVLLNHFGAFVVHDVQCWLVVPSNRIAKTLVKGAMKEASVRKAIGWTMMALRS
jgi:hypothetical protein